MLGDERRRRLQRRSGRIGVAGERLVEARDEHGGALRLEAVGPLLSILVRSEQLVFGDAEFLIANREADAVAGVTLADAAVQCDQYVALLLDALDDEDERVLRAAADACDMIAVCLGAAELSTERDRLRE